MWHSRIFIVLTLFGGCAVLYVLAGCSNSEKKDIDDLTEIIDKKDVRMRLTRWVDEVLEEVSPGNGLEYQPEGTFGNFVLEREFDWSLLGLRADSSEVRVEVSYRDEKDAVFFRERGARAGIVVAVSSDDTSYRHMVRQQRGRVAVISWSRD